MPLDAEKMSSAVFEAFKELNESGEAYTPDKANEIFGNVILKYICDNTVIEYGWNAQNPTGALDDTTFNATVSGGGKLEPSLIEDPYPATLNKMLEDLTGLIKGLTINAPPGFAISLAWNPAGKISAEMDGETEQKDALQSLCDGIVTSIKKSFKNPTPASGANAAFVGATTSMTIS
jgi:hypothetical protein